MRSNEEERSAKVERSATDDERAADDKRAADEERAAANREEDRVFMVLISGVDDVREGELDGVPDGKPDVRSTNLGFEHNTKTNTSCSIS